jgi:hypothetical protein
LYSQDRMRARWMGGRVRRVARVGLAVDDHDGEVAFSFSAYIGYLLWPSVSGRSGHLSK